MEENAIILPEVYGRRELNARYREIPLKDTTYRTLRKYFRAMANLYGNVPLEKVYEIIHQQSPQLVTEAEFLAFAEIARHECDPFSILKPDEIYMDSESDSPFQWELFDKWLLITEEDLLWPTKESQQGKPYYIPDKKELLCYADPSYLEETPELTALVSFLANRMELSLKDCSLVYFELIRHTRYITSAQNMLFEALEEDGVVFASKEELEEFMQLYQNFSNNCRMQCNRGYTPQELSAMIPPEKRVPQSITLGPNIRKLIADGSMDPNALRADILSMNLPNEELRLDLLRQLHEIENSLRPPKVSRNAPCPCGSGKKYKHCCGKSK